MYRITQQTVVNEFPYIVISEDALKESQLDNLKNIPKDIVDKLSSHKSKREVPIVAKQVAYTTQNIQLFI